MSDTLLQLPDETFHRVSLKALIYDDKNRLLVLKNNENMWEMPGGGWGTGESFETCLTRELGEEIGGKLGEIGNIEFCYQGKTINGYPKVSIAVNVGLTDFSDKPEEVDLLESKFVTREEFVTLQFDPGDAAITNYGEQIWRS
jgi:8-oxo-dGTP pyrophosphatase MutT (NUDIX family)